jgi:hypothetical protein
MHFVSGDLLEAYSSRNTYTYPARVASAFFSIVAGSTPTPHPKGVNVEAAGSHKVKDTAAISRTPVEHAQEGLVGSDGSSEGEGKRPASAAADDATVATRPAERTAGEATGHKEGGETGGKVVVLKADGAGQGQKVELAISSD